MPAAEEDAECTQERKAEFDPEHTVVARRNAIPRGRRGAVLNNYFHNPMGMCLQTSGILRKSLCPENHVRYSCHIECAGWHVVKIDSRYATLEPIAMGLKNIHAATGAGDARGLALRVDHGTQYLSDHFHNQLRHWGIKLSYGFIHGPRVDGVAKRFSRALKEQAIYGRIFQNSAAPRAAVARFVETYNQHWLVAKLGHPSPTQARHEYGLAFTE